MVDINKYLEQVSGQADPYGQNPFAGDMAEPEEGATPFADELPFRFTQFALNPSTEATSGQAGRSPVARSPYTSGSAAQELRALRDKIAGLPSTPPGAAPTLPTLQPQEFNFDLSKLTPDQPDMRWGLPIKDYQVPTRLLEDYGGRNPVDLAIQYGRGGSLRGQFGEETVDWDKYKDSPMTTVTGYDVERMLGADKWNSILNAKSLDPGDEDRLFYNLALLPTSINPDLENKENLASLALRDFTDVNRSLVTNPEALKAAEEMGYDVSSGRLPPGAEQALLDSGFNQPLQIKDPNYQFNPADAAYLLRTNPQASGLRGFGQQWAPTAIQAGAAATIGGAIGGAAGPAIGLSGGGGGLAGLAGFSPGVTATGVNLIGNLAGGVGLQKVLEASGIPMDNPFAQMLTKMGGAAAMGILQGGGISADTMRQEQIATAQQLGFSNLDEYANQILGTNTIDDFINQQMGSLQEYIDSGQPLYNITNSGVQQVDPTTFMQGAGGVKSPFSGKDAVGGLQSGLQTYMQMNPGATGGGIPAEQMFDPNAYTPEQLAEYEAAMIEYNKMMDDYATRLKLQEEYEQKMSDFMEQSNAYKTYNMLRSQQEQLRSGIQSNIAENPFYQADPRLRGIQSGLID